MNGRCSVLLAVLAVAVLAATPHNRSIKSVSINANTYYEFGYQLGRAFREQTQAFYKEYEPLQKKLLPFYQTDEGRDLVDQWLAAVSQHFPHLLEETIGFAVGTGVPVAQVQLMMLRPEIALYMKSQRESSFDLRTLNEGCTTVTGTTDKGGVVMGHNEDGDIEVQRVNGGVWVEAQVAKRQYRFYCYPGELCGNAFGMSHEGIGISMNAQYPRYVKPGAMPRYYQARAVYDLKSDEEAISMFNRVVTASGFSTNFINPHTGRVASVEVAADATGAKPALVHVTRAGKGDPFHLQFNMYNDLDVEQWDSESSFHRMAAAIKHRPIRDLDGIRGVLGDHRDRHLPIYRNGVAPDYGVTLASGLFRSVKDAAGHPSLRMSLLMTNPQEEPVALLTRQLPDPADVIVYDE